MDIIQDLYCAMFEEIYKVNQVTHEFMWTKADHGYEKIFNSNGCSSSEKGNTYNEEVRLPQAYIAMIDSLVERKYRTSNLPPKEAISRAVVTRIATMYPFATIVTRIMTTSSDLLNTLTRIPTTSNPYIRGCTISETQTRADPLRSLIVMVPRIIPSTRFPWVTVQLRSLTWIPGTILSKKGTTGRNFYYVTIRTVSSGGVRKICISIIWMNILNLCQISKEVLQLFTKILFRKRLSLLILFRFSEWSARCLINSSCGNSNIYSTRANYNMNIDMVLFL